MSMTRNTPRSHTSFFNSRRDGQTENRARGGVAMPVEHDICDIIAIRLESHRGQTPITIVNFYCPKQDSRITTAIAKVLSLSATPSSIPEILTPAIDTGIAIEQIPMDRVFLITLQVTNIIF
ncbi:unnamed protein product [Leptidea sinapis]|uniref:Uncharacterized protein n=1 Tax=Leptidea sinapis TaxID=189913 RepID=A0A5E4PUR4_9NEOP|nr:unnamed protein product [Leptidea sinapis]